MGVDLTATALMIDSSDDGLTLLISGCTFQRNNNSGDEAIGSVVKQSRAALCDLLRAYQ